MQIKQKNKSFKEIFTEKHKTKTPKKFPRIFSKKKVDCKKFTLTMDQFF